MSRDITVRFRATDKEGQELHRRATEAGKTVTQLIREALFPEETVMTHAIFVPAATLVDQVKAKLDARIAAKPKSRKWLCPCGSVNFGDCCTRCGTGRGE